MRLPTEGGAPRGPPSPGAKRSGRFEGFDVAQGGLMGRILPRPAERDEWTVDVEEEYGALGRTGHDSTVPSRRSDWFRLLGEGGEAELLLLGDAAAGVPEAVAAVRDITVIHLNAAEGPQPR